MGYSCSKHIEAHSCEPAIATLQKFFEVHDAIQRNDFEKARKLITNGVDVNCINYYGATPLIETCKGKCPNRKNAERECFVRFLIKNGANTSQSDIYGWKALLYAQENGHTSIANILENIEQRRSKIEKRVDEEFTFELTCNMKLRTQDERNQEDKIQNVYDHI